MINGFTPIDLEDNEDYKFLLSLKYKYRFEDNEIIIEDIENLEDIIAQDFIVDNLVAEDKIRADIQSYDKKILEDTEQGHWSLWEDKTLDKDKSIKLSLSTPFVARNPKSSIVDGIVGIDFGTKSTVVVYQNERANIHPMRVGTGDLSKTISSYHYENPTIMEFNNLKKFMIDYLSKDYRPYTKWADLTISHTAANSLIGSQSKYFNTFLEELKQWAGDKNRTLKLVDKQGFIADLPPFLDLENDEINPIELYAYYLGLYINNLRNGIYLNYVLSFPVTYESTIRDKIIKSFEKGIKKSLPPQLEKEEIEKLSVIKGVSEPAAYAVIALREYGFEPEDDEKVFFGIFDFGGGTTDFDFGIYREASGAKERRYDYVIEHFGAGGDRFLGGENLLELLAFEVFKKNKEKLLEKSIQFEKHPEKDIFAGSEVLLSNSREAKMNTKTLVETLRALWENDENKKDYYDSYDSGTLGVNLSDKDGKQIANFELDIQKDELINILYKRIEKGVNNFFDSLRLAFSNQKIDLKDIDKINIFLAGNSSKSNILREIFDKKLQSEEEDIKESLQDSQENYFELFEPLGSDEENVEKPTGKTGVAFGLIETRKGGDIKVINHNINENNEINFKYYLGESRKKKFKVLIDRETEYNKWIDFIDASVNEFDLYYSSDPIVSTNKVSILDDGIKKMIIKLDIEDENALVYIRLVSPSEIEYVVAYEDEIKNEKYLTDIKRIVLGD